MSKKYATTTSMCGEVIRKVKLNSEDHWGCIDEDRLLGPWEEVSPGNWRRRGPDGYRTMFDADAGYATFHEGGVPAGNFGAYGPDGLLEESSHVWGKGDGTMTAEEYLVDLKEFVDSTLKVFGWLLGEDDGRNQTEVHVRTADREDRSGQVLLGKIKAWASRSLHG